MTHPLCCYILRVGGACTPANGKENTEDQFFHIFSFSCCLISIDRPVCRYCKGFVKHSRIRREGHTQRRMEAHGLYFSPEEKLL